MSDLIKTEFFSQGKEDRTGKREEKGGGGRGRERKRASHAR